MAPTASFYDFVSIDIMKIECDFIMKFVNQLIMNSRENIILFDMKRPTKAMDNYNKILYFIGLLALRLNYFLIVYFVS